ncbi:hypothetical protein BT96DRAFT_810698, partial [Gymnopus androsaceus JB14]
MPALVLSSVSSQWRQITLSFSALWSRMSLILEVGNITEKSLAASRGFISNVELHVQRSGTSLLRLRID